MNRRLSYIEIAASTSLHTLFNMIDIVFNTSDKIQNNRTPFEILAHLTEELGELAEEMIIHEGLSYKSAGKDGIVGEAVDAIICILDLVHRTRPECTADQLAKIAELKCSKWEEKAQGRR